MLLLYAFVKFVAYSGWCYFGLCLFHPATARATWAVCYGAMRWLIGLFFGVLVFLFVGSISEDEVTTIYFALYTPLRLLEWGIIAAMIPARHDEPEGLSPSRRYIPLWIAGGILVSFVTDLASPEGLAGKFCIGRCLC